MPYFKDIDTLYLHIPKTGGMSIEYYFYRLCNIGERNTSNLYGWYLNMESHIRVPDERTLQHFTYAEIVGEQYADFFPKEIAKQETRIVVSVRNPYDRMVSEIFWNKCIPFDRLDPTPEKVENAIRFYLYEDKSVQDHRRPQYNFILDTNGKPMTHIHVVRCETLTEDMRTLGFSDFKERVNQNDYYTPEKYQSILTENARRMIEEYYKEDFLYFGYKPISIPLTMSLPQYHTTIVTAFITNINQSNSRSITDYIEYGKKLLSLPVPIVCFIEEPIYNEYFKMQLNLYRNTTFIFTEKKDIYLYNYRDEITDFSLVTDSPDKNTLEYMFVQCNKTEWVREAIDLNIYKTSQYIWIDFGIYHMIMDDNNMREGILSMVQKQYNQLRIASCKYKEYTVPYNVYRIITWTFAGSVFGGDAESLLRFAYLTKTEILKTIKQRKTLMWEINIWYLIKLQHADFMDFYTTSHDSRILKLY